jgi:serine/threonine protein kinase
MGNLCLPSSFAPGDDGEPPFHQAYKLLEEIGQGGTATVYAAQRIVPWPEEIEAESSSSSSLSSSPPPLLLLLPGHSESSHSGLVRGGNFGPRSRDVCVKVVRTAEFTPSEVAALLQEAAFLKELDHPNVVKCYGLHRRPQKPANAVLVLERVTGGELFDRLAVKTVYPEHDAKQLLRGLLNALQHLRQHAIVHRDLKVASLLLRSSSSDTDVVLIDFGLAARVGTGDGNGANGDNSGAKTLTAQCGTANYVSPEVLAEVPYGCAPDVWSCGVVAFVVLGGYPPFAADTDELTFAKIRKAAYTFDPRWWGGVSRTCKDLVGQMLNPDQDARPTPAQCLSHEWFVAPPSPSMWKRNTDPRSSGSTGAATAGDGGAGRSSSFSSNHSGGGGSNSGSRSPRDPTPDSGRPGGRPSTPRKETWVGSRSGTPLAMRFGRQMSNGSDECGQRLPARPSRPVINV